MKHCRILRSSCLVLLAGITVLHAQDRPAPAGAAWETAVRPRMHLAPDKPMYRPGETVWLRGFLLDAVKQTPVADAVFANLQIKSPKGDVVFQSGAPVQHGVFGLFWKVPEAQSGGEYTAVASFPGAGFAPGETRFDVRAYRVPRLRTDLQFLRKGYGPGEEVTASLAATRAEGGIPAGAAVTAVARLDGAEIHRSELRLDDRGGCTVRFALPQAIADGDGSLALVIQDGGVQETAARTLPIVLNKVAFALFPEGGELVAGIENRVYFAARDTRQKPADVAGRVLDESGAEVARFAAVHEGRGSFRFTPAAGRRYVAAFDRPAGNTQRIELPVAVAEGWTLRSAAEVFAAGENVRLAVASPGGGKVRLVLSKIDLEIAASSATLEAGREIELHLAAPPGVHGVLRATLFDESGTPRAERLVFRRPDRALKIALKTTPERTVPGAKVTVEVRTTDATGKPVAAVVGLAATDDAVLEQIEKRERSPRLPVQVLLGQDVRELADAHVYLADGAEAPRAIDLLLGTQGWRRFAWVDPDKAVQNHGDAILRALARVTPPAPGQEGGRVEGVDLRAVLEKNVVGRPDAAPPRPGPGPKPDPVRALAEPAIAADPAADKPQRQAKEADRKNKAEEAAGAPADAEWDGERADALDEDDGRLARRGFAGRKKALQWIRVYAHAALPGRGPDERSDFTETVYWNAGLATDAEGKATFTFDLSDSVTSVRVRADGFASDGSLGEADAVLEARKPFFLEPKLPLEVTAGDLIEVPVAIANRTESDLAARLTTAVATGLVREGSEPETMLAKDSSNRLWLTLVAGKHNGPVAVEIYGVAGEFSDRVSRTIAVAPFGFPIEESFGGRLSGSAKHIVRIPEGVEPSSLVTQAMVYPSPLATLTEAVRGLLREPNGCFEQTSSTAYPNVMVMRYLKSHHVSDASLVARAGDLLDRGYKRLAGFECKQKGYEWFGGDPGHEALTAYGMMEFRDMSEVYAVDAEMMNRTRGWLNARRDGKGGFARNERALDSFGGAPVEITNAYIVWALQEAGETDLAKEVAAVKERALASNDGYLLALAANVLLNAKDDGALAVMDKLTGKQEADGAVRGAATSITRSGGEGLEIETTSLAILAWLRAPGHEPMCDKAARWLFERCKGGRFGATQSTVLALKAILGYDAAMARPKAPGKVALRIDGQTVRELPFGTDDAGTLDLGAFADRLTPGEHAIELVMEGGSEMPYALQVRYSAAKPANHPDCAVRLKTALSSAQVREGETVDLAVELTNATQEGQPMTVAIIGLPGGLEPRHDQLKELVKSGTVDFYETRGREVILYQRCLRPGEVVKANLSLIAAVPGRYTGPASRAYLYYTDERKQWTDPLQVTVARAGE